MPFPSLHLGFLFTLPGRLVGDSCVSTGRPLSLPGFRWWPLEAFEAFVFHPLSNPREPPNEHSLLLTTLAPGRALQPASLSHPFPRPGKSFLKKFSVSWRKAFSSCRNALRGDSPFILFFDWCCLGHLIPHPRWAFCNTLGLNKLYFQRLRLDLAVNCPADVSVIFWTQEKVWELVGILWKEEISSAGVSWARIFLLQRIEFCLLLQVMAVGQIELFSSGVPYSGSSWMWVATVILPVSLYSQGEKYREKQDGEWQEEKNTKEEEE